MIDNLFSPLQSELQSDPKVINDIIALALHDALTYDKVGLHSDCALCLCLKRGLMALPFRECTKCA
jgi:hypothetical protein